MQLCVSTRARAHSCECKLRLMKSAEVMPRGYNRGVTRPRAREGVEMRSEDLKHFYIHRGRVYLCDCGRGKLCIELMILRFYGVGIWRGGLEGAE